MPFTFLRRAPCEHCGATVRLFRDDDTRQVVATDAVQNRPHAPDCNPQYRRGVKQRQDEAKARARITAGDHAPFQPCRRCGASITVMFGRLWNPNGTRHDHPTDIPPDTGDQLSGVNRA